MIFDSHMHIGAHGAEFGVSLDAAGLVSAMRLSAVTAKRFEGTRKGKRHASSEGRKPE